MLRLGLDNAELGGGKLKIGKGISKPNLRAGGELNLFVIDLFESKVVLQIDEGAAAAPTLLKLC